MHLPFGWVAWCDAYACQPNWVICIPFIRARARTFGMLLVLRPVFLVSNVVAFYSHSKCRTNVEIYKKFIFFILYLAYRPLC